MAESGAQSKLSWPEHGLDWTIKFPALVNDGRGGQEIFEMDTAQMMKRSKYVEQQLLHYYDPAGPGNTQAIKVPECEVQTFEYYLCCIATGQVVLNDSAFGTEVPETGDAGVGATDGHAVGDEMMLHDKVTAYCKGYFLAEQLGDYGIANKIMDALIDCFVENKVVFADDHVLLVEQLEGLPHTGSLDSNLWTLIVKTRVFTAPLECGWRLLSSRTPYPRYSALFQHCLINERKAYGLDRNGRDKGYDYHFVTEGRDIYYSYNRLHPRQ